MVLLVLVFHSGASYGSAVDFWPFHDRDPSKVIDLFMFVLDVFMMAVFFFVAGYFSLPSIRKRGAKGFVREKLIRLGLPWLAIVALLLPLLDYFHYRHNATDLPVRGYGEHWLLSMKRAGGFDVGWMNMSTYTDMTGQFYQRYMWYVSLLILFFLVFALLFFMHGRLSRRPGSPVPGQPSRGSVALGFAVAALVGVAFFAAARLLLYGDFLDKGWFSLGNIFQFQCGKLVLYACCFGLGVYAFSGQWFAGGNRLGRPWLWWLACFLFFGATMSVLAGLHKVPNLTVLRFAFVVLYPLWTLAFVGAFLSLSAGRWGRTTTLKKSLAGHSYNMYLAHYAVPMALPLLLAPWAAPTVIKFALVSAATLVLSYAASRWLIGPFPRSVVIGLVVLSVVVTLLT
jgi:heme/copper-type cytochrome/quinol oxidase subunit 2